MIKKIITFFTILACLSNPAFSQEKKETFTFLSQNQPSPYDGFLFTPEAVVKIYTTVEEEKEKLKIEHKLEISKLVLEINKVNSLMKVEISNKETLIENITTSKNKTISDLTGQVSAGKWYVAGAFLGGVLLTGSIVYFIAGINK